MRFNKVAVKTLLRMRIYLASKMENVKVNCQKTQGLYSVLEGLHRGE